MTPQELMATPVGTRLRYEVDAPDGEMPGEYDYGTLRIAGNITEIDWDADEIYEAKTTIMDLSRRPWVRFIEDISVAPTTEL
jgi:hypothetical protein